MNLSYLITYLSVSTILWLLYKLVLENNRSFVFNRFYLLACIIFPLTIPHINLDYSINATEEIAILQAAIPINYAFSEFVPSTLSSSNNEGFPPIMYLYLFVFTVLFIRFLLNAIALFNRSCSNEKIKANGYTIVLIDELISPYSFLSYIFVNKQDFKTNKISYEIISHEYAHVYQKHSLDIFFVEFMSTFLWINPFVYLTKKAIQLNHEFLADKYALQTANDLTSYQKILIHHINKSNYHQFTSTFNYFTTKKRLIMMTKVQNMASIVSRQLIIIPAVLILILVFGKTNIAQVAQKQSNKPPTDQISNESNLINEYLKIIEKGRINKDEYDLSKFDLDDKKRLKEIYFQTGNQGKTKLVNTGIVPNFFGISYKSVNANDLKKWIDDDVFTIIVDMKVMQKKDMANFKSEDFIDHRVGWWNKPKHTKTKKYYGVWLTTHEKFNSDFELTILPKFLERDENAEEKH